jgi:hypothetical protein
LSRAAVLCLGALPACELAESTLPATESVIVLHGVLSASSPLQYVLVERTWNGSHVVNTGGSPPYNPGDPISTGGGYAEVNAGVEVTTPDGRTLPGTELRLVTADGCCAGVYTFPIVSADLAAGGRYRVRVHTTTGESVTAETTVPAAVAASPLARRPFDRTRDTIALDWPPVPDARGYQLRIETPYGAYTAFTDRTDARLPGGLRNVFVEGLPHVLLPGFRQRVTVTAVDSNFYDYFRTSNDQYSARGLVSRVQGGIGVFGSAVRVAEYELAVSAPFATALEGQYVFHGAAEDSARTLVIGVTLYVESAATQAGQPDALSGSYRPRPGTASAADSVGALLGIRFGDSVRVALLARQALRDTLDVFRAEVRGDTLVGRYRSRLGEWRFVRKS